MRARTRWLALWSGVALLPVALLAQTAATAADTALVRLIGSWQVGYQDVLLGTVTGRAVVERDPAGRPTVRYSVLDPRTGRSYELRFVRATLRSDSLELELIGDSPSGALMLDGGALPASVDTLTVPREAEITARVDGGRAPVIRVAAAATRPRAVHFTFRLAPDASRSTRLEGTWRIARDSATGFRGTRSGERIAVSGLAALRPLETMIGVETWTREPTAVVDAADLSARIIQGVPGTNRVSVVVENGGPGTATDLRVHISGGPGLSLCQETDGCSANELLQAWSGRCAEGACTPCEVEPGTLRDRPGIFLGCRESLGPGERVEIPIELARASPPPDAQRCEAPEAAIQAVSDAEDPNPSNNTTAWYLGNTPPRVRAIWIVPSDGPLDSTRAVSSVPVGTEFRVLVKTVEPLCQRDSIPVSFRRPDGTESQYVHTAVPFTPEDSKLATTKSINLINAYWGPVHWTPVPVQSWGNRPVPPAPGDHLDVWAGERYLRLLVADLPVPVTVALVSMGLNAETRPDRTVRPGEKYRIEVRTVPESGLPRRYLPVMHTRVFPVEGSRTTIRYLNDHDGDGMYRSDWETVVESPGTRLEVRFAHAPVQPDEVGQHWLLVKDPVRASVSWLVPTGLPPSRDYGSDRENIVCLGCPFIIEVIDSLSAMPNQITVDLAATRNGEVAFRTTLTASGISPRALRTAPVVLSQTPPQELQKYDHLTASIASHDLVSSTLVVDHPWYDQRMKFVTAGQARDLGVRPRPWTDDHLTEVPMGQQIGLEFRGKIAAPTWARPAPHVSLHHRRAGAVLSTRTIPLSEGRAPDQWFAVIDTHDGSFDLALEPGDLIEANFPVGVRPAFGLQATATIVRNPGSGPTVAFEASDSPDRFERTTTAALSSAVRVAIDFAEAPSDPVIEARLKWVRARGAPREFLAPLVRDSVNPRRYLGIPIQLAAEAARRTVAAGDRLEASYLTSAPASLMLTGRPGLATRIRFLSPNTTLPETDRGLRAVPHNDGLWIDIDFEAAPSEARITVELAVLPIGGEARRVYLIPADRLSAPGNRYRASMPLLWSEQMGFSPGKQIHASYAGVEATARIETGPLPAGFGRLEVVAERPSYAAEPVRVNASIQDLGSTKAVNAISAPGTIDVPAGRYAVSLCYESSRACYGDTVDVAAGESKSIKIASTDVGRLRFADALGRPLRTELLRLYRTEDPADEWSRRWTIPDHDFKSPYFDLPAGRYDGTVERLDGLGLEHFWVEVVGGADKPVRLDAAGTILLRVVDVTGGNLVGLRYQSVTSGSRSHGTHFEVRSGVPHKLRPGIYRNSTPGVLVNTDDVEVTVDKTTEVTLRFGRLELRNASPAAPGETATVRAPGTGLSRELTPGVPLLATPGIYQVVFGGGTDQVIKEVQVTAGETIVVGRSVTGNARARILAPKEAVGAIDWSVSIEGSSSDVASYERKHVVRTSEQSIMETELPPGRFTALVRGTATSGNSVQSIVWMQRFEVVAGGTRTVAPPAMGVIEVTLCKPAELWLSPGPRGVFITSPRAISLTRFVVPEADYMLRPREGGSERAVASRAGEITRVRMECPQ